MKRLLALFLVVLFAYPANAHFIWLAPHAGGQVRMVFSDSLDPDANVAITKIAQTKVDARSQGMPIKVTKTEAKDHYLFAFAAFNAKSPVEVAGVCQYGVLAKKGDPYLLMYYAKTSLNIPVNSPTLVAPWSSLKLEVMSARAGSSYYVLWQGKIAADVEVSALVPGEDEPRVLKRATDGTFPLGAVPAGASGLVAVRAKFVEKKEGELDGKAYKEVRHYSTWSVALPTSSAVQPAPGPKADAAATKLLADARAARAGWNNFPGFRADLEANVNGKVAKGTVAVDAGGKVTLKLEADDDIKGWARREISSLVSHRLPGGTLDTPCAFIGTDASHPSGRAIRVLNDELHSSYRIRDRQIIEVNRAMKDIRFTITVLENTMNKEKQFMPTSYVVNSWDLKTNALVSSSAHHNTWTRVGAFDLPVRVRVVNAKTGQLDSRLLTFSNTQLVK